MKSTLLVCSKSTAGLLDGYKRRRIVTSASSKDILREEGTEDDVVAIGGGAVIDTAKILSNTPIKCYPTTASGSTATSWSVYWDGPQKHSQKRMLPEVAELRKELYEGDPQKVLNDTTCDVISHCFDSLNSTKSNEESEKYVQEALSLVKTRDKKDLMEAGHIAGKAIEITGTNLLHSLSYPLTGHFGVSHGTALGFYLKVFWDIYDFDFDD